MMKSIRSMMKLYWGPIFFTIISIMGLGVWFLNVPKQVDALGEQRNRQAVEDIYGLVAATVQGLVSQCSIQDDRSLLILENIVDNSVLWYVMVQRQGRTLVRTSQAPATLTLPSDEGHLTIMGRFRYWRKIDLPCNDQYPVQHEPSTAQPTGSVVDDVLVLVGEIPKDDEAFVRELKGRHLGMMVVFVTVATSAFLWIMRIRHRLISEKLENKHLRLKHLEEMNLAAAGLAHETKNPLGIISAIAQQISRQSETTDNSRHLLGQILDEVDNASARLGHFMNFARAQNVKSVTIEASNVINKVTRVLVSEFDVLGVELVADCPQLWISADEKVMRQILVNLLLNSLRASVQGDKVLIRMVSNGRRAVLEVVDWGCGIPPSLMPKIFKPYVTGHSTGHGLGLAIVKRLVEQHGWSIRISSDENKGTRVTISDIIANKKPG